MSDTRTVMLRRALATLAYRTAKALRDAPAEFSGFEPGHGVRTPHALIVHMASVIQFARTGLTGEARERIVPSTWEADRDRFWNELEALDRALAAGIEFEEEAAERTLQGPIADAITHAGQLAMLRRMAGSPISGENFRAADIRTGRVGPDQPDAVKPFEPRG